MDKIKLGLLVATMLFGGSATGVVLTDATVDPVDNMYYEVYHEPYNDGYVVDEEDDTTTEITTIETTTETTTYNTDVYYVSAEDGANIRSSASMGDNIVCCLDYQTPINVIGKSIEDENWIRILFGEQQVYYIHRSCISEEYPPDKPKMIDKGIFNLTAYEYGTGGNALNGKAQTIGYTVAAHRNDFNLGDRIYIEGYGEYVVEDRGGFPQGTIDIFLGSPSDCYTFGRRSARVYKIVD